MGFCTRWNDRDIWRICTRGSLLQMRLWQFNSGPGPGYDWGCECYVILCYKWDCDSPRVVLVQDINGVVNVMFVKIDKEFKGLFMLFVPVCWFMIISLAWSLPRWKASHYLQSFVKLRPYWLIWQFNHSAPWLAPLNNWFLFMQICFEKKKFNFKPMKCGVKICRLHLFLLLFTTSGIL